MKDHGCMGQDGGGSVARQRSSASKIVSRHPLDGVSGRTLGYRTWDGNDGVTM